MILHRTYYGYEDENENSDSWEWYTDDEQDDISSQEDLEEGLMDEEGTYILFKPEMKLGTMKVIFNFVTFKMLLWKYNSNVSPLWQVGV